MPALPAELNRRCRNALMDCKEFDDNASVRTLFTTSDLAQALTPFSRDLPEASSKFSRVTQVLAYVLNKRYRDDKGEEHPVLPLLLLALHFNRPSDDAISAELGELAQAVQDVLAPNKPLLMKPGSTSGGSTSSSAHDSASPTKVVVDEVYTDLEIHISPRDVIRGSYAVIARLDGGSPHRGILQMDQSTRQALTTEVDPDLYGQRLFNILFSGDVYAAYAVALERARAHEGRLRLRLSIDYDAADLHALVWERLRYRVESDSFRVATNAKSPFSRYFELRREESLPIEGPVRILCVVANPQDLQTKYKDLSPLNVEAEVAGLRNALDGLHQAGVHITFMPGQSGLSNALREELDRAGYTIESSNATLDNIITLLAHHPGYQLVHIVSHGAFSSKHDQAQLLLEDENGAVAEVRDKVIAQRIHSLEHKPHLVFLAACESATRDADDATPFVGLGPQLIQAGVPAVVAMQDKILMAQSQKLAQHFYGFLLEHGIVDKAMNQARDFLTGGEGWDVPVLFMHLREGRLFKESELPHFGMV